MMTIGERLLAAGVEVNQKIWGKYVTINGAGSYLCEFEDIDPLLLVTDQGEDPREACYVHFTRPAPTIAVNDVLKDANDYEWTVVQDRDDNPNRATVRFKVEKVIT